MDQYRVTLTGLTPLLMHDMNLLFMEKTKAWQKDPANKELSVAGDDRSPAWTWISYAYHNRRTLGISSDNLMTMLREGGAKVPTGRRQETYKKHTQSGIMIDQEQWELTINGHGFPVAPINDLVGNTDFLAHLDAVEGMGFELLVKPAKIGRAKHIRVRPMFRDWQLSGSFTVLDPDLSGLTKKTLETILRQAGSLCGLCDWRPSSGASGTFGKFSAELEKMK